MKHIVRIGGSAPPAGYSSFFLRRKMITASNTTAAAMQTKRTVEVSITVLLSRTLSNEP